MGPWGMAEPLWGWWGPQGDGRTPKDSGVPMEWWGPEGDSRTLRNWWDPRELLGILR